MPLRAGLPNAAAINCASRSRAAADVASGRAVELLALDEALKSLAALDPRKGQIIELRFFGGLTTQEIAEVLGRLRLDSRTRMAAGQGLAATRNGKKAVGSRQ